MNSDYPTDSPPASRYEAQKRRDWNTFVQFLSIIDRFVPGTGPVSLTHCTWNHVLNFLSYLDRFGKTRVHTVDCPFYGHPDPPEPCSCPLQQAWGSLDSIVGRLRAAFDEFGGSSNFNPFAAAEVRVHLRDLRDEQCRARGIRYDKNHKKVRLNPRKRKMIVIDSNAGVGTSSDALPPLPDVAWTAGGVMINEI